MSLVILSRGILCCILAEWLDLIAIANLDSAVCQHSLRVSFENVLCEMFVDNCADQGNFYDDNFVEWLLARQICLSNIRIYDRMLPEYIDALQSGVLSRCRSLVLICEQLQIVTPIIENVKMLTDMDLSGCDFIDDEVIISLGHNCRSLSTCNISFCDNLSDQGIVFMVHHCQLITDITLDYCANVSDESMLAIGSLCLLVRLSLVGCRLITGRTLELLANGSIDNLSSVDLESTNISKNDSAGKSFERLVQRYGAILIHIGLGGVCKDYMLMMMAMYCGASLTSVDVTCPFGSKMDSVALLEPLFIKCSSIANLTIHLQKVVVECPSTIARLCYKHLHAIKKVEVKVFKFEGYDTYKAIASMFNCFSIHRDIYINEGKCFTIAGDVLPQNQTAIMFGEALAVTSSAIFFSNILSWKTQGVHSLSIHHCTIFTEWLSRFMVKHSSLKKLHISSCSALTELTELFTLCGSLEILELHWSKVTEGELDFAVKVCKKLQVLELMYCENVSQRWVDELTDSIKMGIIPLELTYL